MVPKHSPGVSGSSQGRGMMARAPGIKRGLSSVADCAWLRECTEGWARRNCWMTAALEDAVSSAMLVADACGHADATHALRWRQ